MRARPRFFPGFGKGSAIPFFVAMVLTALWVTPGAFAATLQGTVTASDGAALPGVAVSAVGVASGRSVQAFTDAEGRYSLTSLPAGVYRVTAGLQGFSDAVATVRLTADAADLTEDFQLDLGTIEEEISVTASKSGERSTAEIPQGITIITSDDIEDLQLESTEDAIERAPNVRSIDQNPARARPQFRGLSSSRLLILVDGERLNNVRFDAGATGISPGMIDVTQIETVEVLGGAGSGIYGTDAMAGVINIITKQPDRPLSGSVLGVGLDLSYNENSEYSKGVLSLDYGSGKWTVRGSYSQFEIEGWTAGDGRVTKEQVVSIADFANEVSIATGSTNFPQSFAVWEFGDGQQVANAVGEGINLQVDVGYHFSDSQRLRFKYLTSQHEDIGLPFSTPPTDPTTRTNAFRDLSRYTLSYDHFDLASWLPRLNIRLYQQTFERPQNDNRFNIDSGSSWASQGFGQPDVFTGDLSTFTRGREQSTLNDITSTGFEARVNIVPWKGAVLTTGISYLKDESEDTFDFVAFDASGQNVFYSETGVATTPDTEYENQAWYAALEWSPVDWLRVAGGLRWDDWETSANPTAGYPPVQEAYIVGAALPGLEANPGSLNLAGLSGISGLLDGTANLNTDNDVWTGNLGLTFLLPQGIHPFIRWAESYREPEVTVRYLVRNFGSPFFFVTGLPNSELQAEQGETLDYGVKINRRNWRGSLVFFRNEIEDFIGTELSNTAFIAPRPDLAIFSPVGIFFQRINIGEVEFDGWEATFEGSYALPDRRGTLSPYISLSHLNSENKTPDSDDIAVIDQFFNRSDTPHRFEGSASDVPFGNVVEDQGYAGLRYTAPSGKWFTELEYRWVEEVNRVEPGDLASPNISQFGSFSSLDGYDVLNLRGAYEFSTSVPFKLNLGIENLTDEFYFDPFQLAPAPGRSFVVGLHFRWDNLLGN